MALTPKQIADRTIQEAVRLDKKRKPAIPPTANISAIAMAVAHALSAGTHLSGGPFDGSAAVTLTTDATSANTISTIVARDASGNFSAGTVSVTALSATTTVTATTTVSGADLAISTNAHHLKGVTTTPTTVNMLAVSSSNTTRMIAAVDASGSDWTNQAETAQWMLLTSGKLTIWTGGSATAGGGIQIAVDSGSNPSIFNNDPNHHQFGQGNLNLYPVSISGGHGSGATISLSYWSGSSLVAAVSVANVASGTGTLTISPAVKMSHFGAGVAQFDASGNISSVSLGSITGTIAYGQLPTGPGTWNTGSPSNTVTFIGSLSPNAIVGAVAVSGQLNFTNATAVFTIQPGGSVLSLVATSQTAVASITIPNFSGVNDTFAFLTLAQTLSNKTLDGTCVVPAADLTGNLAYAALPTGSGSWDAGSGNTTTITRALTVSGNFQVSSGSNAMTVAASTGLVTASGFVSQSGASPSYGSLDNVSVNMLANNTVVGAWNATQVHLLVETKISPTVNDQIDYSTQAVLHLFTASVQAGPRYTMMAARGTVASPTVVQNGDILGQWGFQGYTGAAYATGATIFAQTSQLWATGTPNSQGTQLIFRTTPNGSATLTTALTLGQDQSAIFAGPVTATAVSVNGNSQATTFQQVNTGTSAGVQSTWSLADSASVVAGAFSVIAAKGGAWTSGTSSSYTAVVSFVVNEATVGTTYMTLDSSLQRVRMFRETQISGTFTASAALLISGTYTATGGSVVAFSISPVLTAAANSDTLQLGQYNATLTPGSFTGVKVIGVNIAALSVASFTTPGDLTMFQIGAATGTGATNAYAIRLGIPTGATNNYFIAATTLSLFNVTAAGLLTCVGVQSSGALLSSAVAGNGYSTGAGGTVTQLTSRTTGVTLSKPCGAITLFTAAGTTAFTTFTVTNTLVAATDVIELSVKSSTNVYLAKVTAVASGSFNITFWTTGGTSSDAPVINFALKKVVTS